MKVAPVLREEHEAPHVADYRACVIHIAQEVVTYWCTTLVEYGSCGPCLAAFQGFQLLVKQYKGEFF